jgi:hypothetical protein
MVCSGGGEADGGWRMAVRAQEVAVRAQEVAVRAQEVTVRA